MKKAFNSGLLAIAVFLLTSLSTFAQSSKYKNKFLDGKKFNVQFYEIKPTGRGKAVPSKVLIKAGKVEADLMYEKFAMPEITYRVLLDSTYTEDEVEMHMVKFEADYTEEKSHYFWEATVINYDIEGTILQKKGGVEKKKYEFAGSEKTKK